MNKTITIRIDEKFLESLDNVIKDSNYLYDQAREAFDIDTLRRFNRIRKFQDRSDFIESALYEIYLFLKNEIDKEKQIIK